MFNKEHHKGGGAGNLLGLAVAATVGAALGLLFAPKKGEEIREDVMVQAKKIAANFNESRAQIQEKLQEIFGEVNEDLEKAYLEIRGNIMAAAEDLKDKAELTQEKYEEIVDEAVKKFAEGKNWTQKSVNNFIKSLQQDTSPLKKKVTKEVKKAVSKVQKTNKNNGNGKKSGKNGNGKTSNGKGNNGKSSNGKSSNKTKSGKK